MKRVALIMAGGSGERFWPLSRKTFPKQLLKLNSTEKTLLEESIDRVAPIIDKNDIYIITSEILAPVMREMLRDFPPENIIPEPAKRNTAPCLALGAAVVIAKYENEGIKPEDISIAVLTADQAISPEDGFVATVDAAMKFAEANHSLVTIGISPSRPETGYGYIELENAMPDSIIYKVKSFREKPSYEAAEEYMKSGNFLWNSGMFFWRASTFANELEKHLPEVGEKINLMKDKVKASLNTPHNSLADHIGEVFSACPSISIDYGLMEKSDCVAVAKAMFEWDDVGAWDALRRTRKADELGNISEGHTSLIDTHNSIVINESGGKIVSSVIGMENVAVIVTCDAIMVCPIDKVQDVKKSVEDIRSRFGEDKWL